MILRYDYAENRCELIDILDSELVVEILNHGKLFCKILLTEYSDLRVVIRLFGQYELGMIKRELERREESSLINKIISAIRNMVLEFNSLIPAELKARIINYAHLLGIAELVISIPEVKETCWVEGNALVIREYLEKIMERQPESDYRAFSALFCFERILKNGYDKWGKSFIPLFIRFLKSDWGYWLSTNKFVYQRLEFLCSELSIGKNSEFLTENQKHFLQSWLARRYYICLSRDYIIGLSLRPFMGLVTGGFLLFSAWMTEGVDNLGRIFMLSQNGRYLSKWELIYLSLLFITPLSLFSSKFTSKLKPKQIFIFGAISEFVGICLLLFFLRSWVLLTFLAFLTVMCLLLGEISNRVPDWQSKVTRCFTISILIFNLGIIVSLVLLYGAAFVFGHSFKVNSTVLALTVSVDLLGGVFSQLLWEDKAFTEQLFSP